MPASAGTALDLQDVWTLMTEGATSWTATFVAEEVVKPSAAFRSLRVPASAKGASPGEGGPRGSDRTSLGTTSRADDRVGREHILSILHSSTPERFSLC